MDFVFVHVACFCIVWLLFLYLVVSVCQYVNRLQNLQMMVTNDY